MLRFPEDVLVTEVPEWRGYAERLNLEKQYWLGQSIEIAWATKGDNPSNTFNNPFNFAVEYTDGSFGIYVDGKPYEMPVNEANMKDKGWFSHTRLIFYLNCSVEDDERFVQIFR